MIPGTPTTADTPLGLLMACHERIHRYLGGLEALAALDDLSDPRAAPTARDCLRYFRDGLPLHGRDEDLSLAPRLRALGLEPRVLEAMDRMTEEHAEVERGLPEVLASLGAVARGQAAPLDQAHRWLSPLLLGHLALEEAHIFPEIVRLPQAEQAAIVDEIRARRR